MATNTLRYFNRYFNVRRIQYASLTVQNALLPHEETNVLILLRGKLRGRARRAINNHKFTTIKQLTDRLQISFGTIRVTCDCNAELKNLSAGWQESDYIGDYIERAQILYDNIIAAEKNEKQSLTNSDISRINCRYLDEFYYDLLSDIRRLVEKRDDLTPVEFYQIVGKANQIREKVRLATSVRRTT